MAGVELSDGMVVESVTNSTEATGTVVGPVVGQPSWNDDPQSFVAPPQAASASVSSAENHLSLRILFT